jgi:hypothetical protein
VDVPTITEDSTPPNPPVITNPAAPANTVGTTFDIQGTAEADSLVRVYTDLNDNGVIDGADAEVASEQLTGGATAFDITTPINQSMANNFTVTAEDALQHESAPSNVPTITETTPPPINPPVISDPAGTITVNRASYTISGTAQADSLVRIYIDANNNGAIDPPLDGVAGQQQLAGGATDFAISVTLTQNSANDFTATADTGSFESAPADVPTIVDNNASTGTGGSSGGDGSCAAAPSRGPLALIAAMLGGAFALVARRRRA